MDCASTTDQPFPLSPMPSGHQSPPDLGKLPFCFGEFPLGHCTISMASSTSWKGRMDSSASHQSLHHRSRFDQFTFTLRLPRIAPADDPL
ncbi:hypothetical protein F2Q68_00025513 [Brassica cretica]|uniref:Uncharacterized protein n=1 Tax=Brassica cretica TaxID=69181 RepID=A0A8S9IHJ3_BRACR|nr:hypothetical protein F2Q68_00025513 [Brassica cretica]